MGAYIARRLLSTLLVMALVGVFVFLLLHLAPGDPASIIAGDNASPAQIAKIRHQLGLDAPLVVQFARWVWQLLHGDFGISIFSEAPVMELIRQRLPSRRCALTSTTISFAAVLAVGAGVLAAWRAGGLLDRVLMGFAALGFSVPVFVVGYVLIYVFAIRLRWLPVQGYVPLSDGLWPWSSHLILPVDRARPGLCRADRAHHARQHAGGAEPRTTCAPRVPRAPAPGRCCCTMR